MSLAWLGTLPFFAYALLFLFVPAGEVLVGAFKSTHGGATLHNLHTIIHPPYIHQYWVTIKISLITAGLGGVFGAFVAYAALREGTPRWIRTVITTFSGVAANFAGVPLAFAFVATLGLTGILTQFLTKHLHWNPWSHGFTIFGMWGVVLAYLYFQIPLMILVIAPAIDGLRREWREAASNLGATPLQFWLRVGLPVLMPSLLGAFILLFGNSFSAYATAYALTSGSIPLIPITIGFYYTGNVLSDPHLAQALAFGMFVVLFVMMALYVPLQRRSARWAR